MGIAAPRKLAIAAMASAVSFAVSCRIGPEAPQHAPTSFEATAANPLAGLAGRVIAPSAVFVVPGTDWLSEDGRWVIRGEATLALHVRSAVEAERIELVALEDAWTAELLWDGEQLPASMVRRDGTLLTITIAPALLANGTHELTIRLASASDRRVVTTLARWHGGAREEFVAADRLRYAYAASFLARGVTGVDSVDQLGGTLFAGPGSVDLEFEEGATFRATVENGSHQDCVFVVSSGEKTSRTRVAPLGRQSLAFTTAPGDARLTLAVEGMAEGYFLWGEPFRLGAMADPRPPIVLVTLDTTRRDSLSPYGGSKRLTPSIGALARTATVYEEAYSTSSWTLPSHASIFTGLIPARHGAGVGSSRLAPLRPTLASLLRDAGYDTAGLPGGPLCSVATGLARGFQRYAEPNGGNVPDAALTDRALARLDEGAGAPPFLFVNYFGPHFPFNEWKSRGERAIRGGSPDIDSLLDGNGIAWNLLVDGKLAIGPGDVDAIREAYDAGVAATDAELGRLLDGLRARGLFERALIVVVADHGELLGEGGHFSHTTRLDDELVAVPMIVKWPGQTRGARVRELVSIVDLFPTILAAAGLAPSPSDGIDLAGDATTLAARAQVVAQEHDRPWHRLFPSMKSGDDVVRIQRRDAFVMMTPGDTLCYGRGWRGWKKEDCAAEGESAVADLPADLLGSLGKRRAGTTALSEEQKRNLRALGYIR